MDKELNENLIWQLKSLIKSKEGRLTKLNKSLSDSLAVSQTAMFDNMNQTGLLFDDNAGLSSKIKEITTELAELRAQLAKAQEHANFLELTKNNLSIQFQ